MNRNNIPLILMLTAGAVTCVITFVRQYEMHRKLISLLIVFLVFYGLGCIIKWTLDYFDSQNHKQEQENAEGGQESDETGGEQSTQKDQGA